MKKTNILLILLLAMLVNACTSPAAGTPTPTVDINAIKTAAVETAIAEVTTTAAAYSPTPPPTATPVPVLQSPTPVPTSTSVTLVTPGDPTSTPIATPTILSAASPTAVLCDDAAWVADVSVEDGTEMAPGQDFEKTWLIKNTGSCTWSQEYKLAFGYGDKMSGQAREIGKIVKPSETVEVSVVFAAPLVAGSYQSYWRMSNIAGVNFGQFFYVDIVVR